MSETITFKRRGNAEHGLVMSSDSFYQINEAARGRHGVSMYELSQTDPTRAYQYLRWAIAAAALENGVEVSQDNIVVAAASLKTTDQIRAIAKAKILMIMPTENEGPFDVSVGLLPQAEDITLGLVDPGDTINVFSLRVQPNSPTT